ncbi:uncharacterized protein MKZ38_002893 [Zalerion maritima]|uniref:Prefoldin subunit 5 n=1 Tax=Zalerion maritima TaxID=339359 RepID=A0AAD5WS52_9PEZI|nr:uncharacterized protein MKZ38_002893 [Zalerion maritima]
MEVSIDSLSPQQLAGLKKQLEEELEHLSSSFNQLAAVQSKFRECLRCVERGVKSSSEEGDSILVPLTTSLYVRGNISQSDKVVVDVGTGFYVEKDTKSTVQFYTAKIQEISGNIQGLEGMVEKKSGSLQLVEEVRKNTSRPLKKQE